MRDGLRYGHLVGRSSDVSFFSTLAARPELAIPICSANSVSAYKPMAMASPWRSL